MLSKRQILDTCNSLILTNKEKYFIYTKGNKEFHATQMTNDLIFQLALEDTVDYEMVLKGVMTWWQESTFNPINKKFKA